MGMAFDTAIGDEMAIDKLVRVKLHTLSERPAVSILITCFNYEAFVGRAIESALDQTYAPSQVIVSDDASTDNSCAVVETYVQRDPRVRLLRNVHGGMAANVNAAYRASSGDIICLLDADDTFMPNKLEEVVRSFQQNPRAGFGIHRASMVDHEGRKRGTSPLLSSLPSGDCARVTYEKSGILRGLPPTTNLSLRREVAERIFPIPTQYTGYAEQMIHRLAPLMTELCAVDAPLAHWRQHGKNDQNATRITARRLEREMKFMDSLWLDQKSYLDSIDPQLGREFPPIGRAPLYLRANYIHLRLTNDPGSQQAHADLCRYGLNSDSKVDLFWRYSNRLPLPLFDRAVNLLLTQSVWKQMVGRAFGKRSA
jgi:glycosyltransferase involved in cell wall biosynthesis